MKVGIVGCGAITGVHVPFILEDNKLLCTTKDLCYDNSRAKKQLGWKPNVSFEEGVRWTFKR
jgi:nucleoside-diphosphate-sugar epimerase